MAIMDGPFKNGQRSGVYFWLIALTESETDMDRMQWYRRLRAGWDPMKASHAWTQALIYDGKELSDVYSLGKNGDPIECLTRITISSYARGAALSIQESNPFLSLFRNA
jgi:hypothetical protein